MSISISYPGTEMGCSISSYTFPDKTSQIWHIPELYLKIGGNLRITWVFESEAEFMHLAQLKRLLAHHKIDPELYLPYLPYARQDKATANDACFALEAFAPLLNALAFKRVIIEDPHSFKAQQLIANCDASFKRINETISFIVTAHEIDLFVYPDNGANQKYSKLIEIPKNLPPIPVMYGHKQRDPATGEITDYKLDVEFWNRRVPEPGVWPHCWEGKRALIIDDICDGGATFVKLAEILRRDFKVGYIHLYVSHGLFSKGRQVLHDAGINDITTLEYERPC